jgi:ribose/xylose/arabinose/galactoside ABC-type transport system permease subunit
MKKHNLIIRKLAGVGIDLGRMATKLTFYLVIAALVWWLLTRMTAGRYIYAVGGNPVASRLAGVPVDRHIWLS